MVTKLGAATKQRESMLVMSVFICPSSNNELIVVILNPLVVPRIQLMGLMLKKINLILIFELTSKFNIQVINS